MKFYLPKQIDEKMKKAAANPNVLLLKKIENFEEKLQNFEKSNEKFENKLQKIEKIGENFDFVVDFEKWNCWCELRKKLKNNEDYSSELKIFKEKFSNHPNLLKMIDELISKKNNKINSDSLINNLLRFARISFISEDDLLNISGYVLLLSFERKIQ